MLNRKAIEEELKRESIYVKNAQENIDKNSINISLGNVIKVYDTPYLDVAQKSPTTEIVIPETGLTLMPNKLYIGATLEFTKTYGFVPMLAGNDELAALGLKTHITAGFGDNGFEGTWTLEIECAMPTVVYPYQPIGLIYYFPLIGEGNQVYRGKYFRQISPTPSKLSQEYEKGRTRKRV